MKKIFLTTVVIVFTAIIFSSCEKKEEILDCEHMGSLELRISTNPHYGGVSDRTELLVFCSLTQDSIILAVDVFNILEGHAFYLKIRGYGLENSDYEEVLLLKKRYSFPKYYTSFKIGFIENPIPEGNGLYGTFMGFSYFENNFHQAENLDWVIFE